MIDTKNSAIRFIILMGFVSLFADMTYEGGRSIASPYLAILGASAVAVGFIFGFGELLGYALRYISGYIADKTKKFWTLTIIGYAVNLFAVPLLALAKSWQIAMLLIFTERIGKALRTPARDAMISYASKRVGRGYSFGLHEALDQIGAVSGPLIVSAVLYFGGYREAFAILAIPAMISMFILLFARKSFPRPELMEISEGQNDVDKNIVDKKENSEKFIKNNHKKLEREMLKGIRAYIIFVFLSVAGFTSFPIIAYHLKTNNISSDEIIPILFAGAMLVDAIFALIFGKMYDKVGFKVLLSIPILTIFIPLFSLSFNVYLIIFGVFIFGSVVGLQETVMRAVVADLSSPEYRGRAYGAFNAVYGIGWFIGNLFIGFLYDKNPEYILPYVVILQILAFIFLLRLFKVSSQK